MNWNDTNRKILIWLWIGFGMILFQILLGGITRLTGSGLSITRWDILTGILFPMGEKSWNYHFELYKQTPQFHKINQDFNLEQFKFIFFWEYLHRLWARIMGLVFLIPFIFFLYKKWISKALLIRLGVVILLAILVASLGWIMVASGLLNRPWVNAYKLSFHLLAAVVLLAYLFYTIHKTYSYYSFPERTKKQKYFYFSLIGLITIQIFLGGVMAGMKAGLAAPTWPKIQNNWIPEPVFHIFNYYNYLFNEYEISVTGPIIIQFFHRSVAYLIFLLVFFYCLHIMKRYKQVQWKAWGLLSICLIQIFLGIWTIIYCIGYVPLWTAVFHQLFGIFLLIYALWLYFTFRVNSNNITHTA